MEVPQPDAVAVHRELELLGVVGELGRVDPEAGEGVDGPLGGLVLRGVGSSLSKAFISDPAVWSPDKPRAEDDAEARSVPAEGAGRIREVLDGLSQIEMECSFGEGTDRRRGFHRKTGARRAVIESCEPHAGLLHVGSGGAWAGLPGHSGRTAGAAPAAAGRGSEPAARYTGAMSPEVLRPQAPSGSSSGAESLEGRLLQDRLRLFGGIAFVIAAAFYAVGQVLARLGRENPLTPAGHASVAAVAVLMGGTWLYCRRGPRSQKALRALDALLLLALGMLVLLVPSGSIPEADLRGMVVLLHVNLILFMRSIFIPSSARRTLAVSAAAALPLAVYSLATETARLSVWKVMWLLAAIAVATAGSAVIYGLRREVRHARQLGQYTLEEKLGEGGMGVVYRARHAMLRRPTAVKLLRPERMGEASLRRFEREVQLTAGLSHPNTVSVFDFGRTPDGVFYYAMEYLDGLTLDELVAGDGPQPPARVAHVLRQVLGALAEAHGIGLVHRDVKPGNVILCERGGLPDVAKVVDFGLVKDLEDEGGLSSRGRPRRHAALPRP